MLKLKHFLVYRKYFLISFITYVISILLGMILSKFLNFDIAANEEGFWNIFAHNFRLGITIMIFGWISLGSVSSLYLGYNGGFLGAFTFSIIKNHGMSPILTGILPHGLIELFAILLFSTLGFETFRYINFLKHRAKNNENIVYYKGFKSSICIFLTATLLLLIATYIESHLSHI
ncbi:stage II sporulation protein M [Bacillus megaterium]|nr:stage II sporulation protein M [Priestia megaterium]